MKNITAFGIGILLLAFSLQPLHAGWEREWIDKFDGNTVNWQFWTAHIQANFNNEIQCYTDDDSSAIKNYDVSDGTLKIIARKGNINCPGLNGQAKTWTSGRLVSKDKREFLYGRLETRLRFSTLQKGTWPAFWALENRIAEDPIKGDNDTVNWPNPGAGEIDIWEWFSNDSDSYITNFFNTSGCGDLFHYDYPGGPNDVLEFHTYAMEWTEQSVKFLMDNQVVHTVDISSCAQYKEPMFLLVNLAMGGNLGGTVDPELNQATLEVDYIAHCSASTSSEFASCNESTPEATDTDNDGISDNLDACNATQSGANVGLDGCDVTEVISEPDNTPETPSFLDSQVLSIFSDTYTSLAGVNFNPNWGQSTIASVISIDDNQLLKYQALNYQGTSFENTPQNVTDFTHVTFDYWTHNASQLNFSLISPGPNETAYSVNIAKGSWQTVSIPLSHFTDVDLSQIFQLKVDGNGTLYVDNIYFYTAAETDATTTHSAPITAATVPEQINADTLSIFSDTLNSIDGVNFNPDWGQNTVATIVEIQGNSVLRYDSLNYQGIAFENTPQNVTNFSHLHFDYWTHNAEQLNLFLISPGPQETAFSVDIVQGSWQQVDVNLSEFSGVDLAQLIQLKVDGNGTVYFDNLYFYSATNNEAVDDSNSDDAVSDDAVSDDAASDDTASDDAASDDAASDDTASDDTASDDTASDDTASDDAASDDTASDDAASDDSAADSINVAPSVTFDVTQNDTPASLILANGGIVRVSVNITDSNANDSHSLDWGNSSVSGTLSGNIFEFNPSGLSAGSYSVVVIVTDNGIPALSTTKTFNFQILAEQSDNDSGGTFQSIWLLIVSFTVYIRRRRGHLSD